MFAYVDVAAILVFLIGVLLVLHFGLGKIVDNFVNSLPIGKQVVLLVLAAGVLTALLVLVRR